jgi:MarR family transcriptional regulator for hemolysin
MSMSQRELPIGLQLTRTSRKVSRAFGAALATAGGSLPMWLVLTSLRGGDWPAQRDLARAVGIEGPTLTRHLDALESAGLVVRRPSASDRRAVQVELTDEGRRKHDELRGVVLQFDRQLRDGLANDDLATLRALLARLEENVSPTRVSP